MATSVAETFTIRIAFQPIDTIELEPEGNVPPAQFCNLDFWPDGITADAHGF